MKKVKTLSVIVPTYNHEKSIKNDLQNIDKTLSIGLNENYDYEIICVNDGSTDNTQKNAEKAKSKKIFIYGYEKNMGKGYAVRYGMSKARGEIISFLDAGMDISPKGIMMLLAHLEWYNADIIVGSKRHPVSRVNYPLKRKLFSIGYHLLVKILFRLPVTDTQSGIKIFKRSVVNAILPKLKIERYAMDIEMLVVAKEMGFKRIYEAPIEVYFDKRTSKIKWSTAIKMAYDTLKFFINIKLRKYLK